VFALVLIALVSILATEGPFASGQDRQPQSVAAPQAKDQPKAGEPSEPPEVAALNDALKITDVGRRYAALQKVIDTYPKTEAANVARTQMSRQLWSGLSAQKNAVGYLAKQLAHSTNPSECNQFAGALLRVDLFLEQAEEVAKRGLSIDEATYLAAAKEAGQIAGRPLSATTRDGVTTYSVGTATGGRGRTRREVSDAELRDEFKTARTDLLATLGEIYARRGKTAEATTTLKQAYASNPPAVTKRAVATTLADLAAKGGDAPGELEYRACAYVLGGASGEARQSLEAAYRKVHGGARGSGVGLGGPTRDPASLGAGDPADHEKDGLEALLDDTYRKSTKTLEVKPYGRPATKTPHMVLAELFTGAACGPCVGADMAFDAVLERFSRQDVAVVVYHQHIPGPDPMTNPATEARKPIYSLRGVPTFAIDGTSTVGGGSADAAESIFNEQIRPAIEKDLAAAPGARVNLEVSMVGSTIKVQARVSAVKSASAHLRLQIALVEELQRYSGPNGIRFHPMVVRSLAGPEFKGFPVTAKGAKVETAFDVTRILADNRNAIDEFLSKPFRGGDVPTFVDGRRDAVDTSRLMVVAFVQDEDPAQDKTAKPAPDAPAGGAQPVVNGPGGQPAEWRPEQASPVRRVLQAAFVRVPPAVKKTTN
jgi:tetratricopeptide (TPR) repeat protein